MLVLQFVVGLILAIILVGVSSYLAFVYPYTGVSLKGLWWGLGTGAVVGLFALAYVLYFVSASWLRD